MVEYFATIAILIVQMSFLLQVGAGIKCPGYCTKDLSRCRGKGGKIIGYCTNSLACCDPIVAVTGSCGDIKFAQTTVYFKSPDYPDYIKGDLNCEFKIKLQEDSVGIRIEFIQVEMDGQSYLRSESDGGYCESDMILFKGFGSWAPPALCGNLTGYTTLIDKYTSLSKDLRTLSVLAIMSSLKYRWHMKISQILKRQVSQNESSGAVIPNTSKMEFDYEDFSIMDEDTPSHRNKRSGIISENDEEESPRNNFLSDPIILSSSTANPLVSATTIIFDATSEETSGFVDVINPTTDISLNPRKRHIQDEIEENETLTKSNTLQNYKYDQPEHRNFEIPLIVNGKDTEIIEVPWQASIRIKANFTKAKLKSAEGKRKSVMFQADVESNELDSKKTQLNTTEASLLNDTISSSENNTFSDKDNCSKSEGYHFCGGVLVANNIILSAAHCFVGNSKNEDMTPLESIEVVLGDTNLCTDESMQEILPSYRYEVASISIHYAYDPHLLINDIAVLRLKKNVTLADNVRPVKIAERGANYSGQDGLVSGWGDTNLTNSETSPSILQSSMNFRIQNQSFCNEKDLEQYTDTKEEIIRHPKYRYVFESTICTVGIKEGEKDKAFEISSGKGDSGGGLIVFDNLGEPVLAGIVSYGVSPTTTTDEENYVADDEDSEGKEKFGKTIDYFTSVAFYKKWIDLAML